MPHGVCQGWKEKHQRGGECNSEVRGSEAPRLETCSRSLHFEGGGDTDKRPHRRRMLRGGCALLPGREASRLRYQLRRRTEQTERPAATGLGGACPAAPGKRTPADKTKTAGGGGGAKAVTCSALLQQLPPPWT